MRKIELSAYEIGTVNIDIFRLDGACACVGTVRASVERVIGPIPVTVQAEAFEPQIDAQIHPEQVFHQAVIGGTLYPVRVRETETGTQYYLTLHGGAADSLIERARK